jgi:hypothetical protein
VRNPGPKIVEAGANVITLAKPGGETTTLLQDDLVPDKAVPVALR